MLFGNVDGRDLGPSMKSMTYYNVVDSWTSAQWVELLSQFYVKANSITIVGQPSASLAETLEREEKERVAATVAREGPLGLAALDKKIKDAQTANDVEIPTEMISQFKVPDVNGIDWIHVESARSGGIAKEDRLFSNKVQDHIDTDVDLPLFVQFDRE